ncbi:MAG: hypothetical protein AAGF92_23890 [Myxococcota bacterium]
MNFRGRARAAIAFLAVWSMACSDEGGDDVMEFSEPLVCENDSLPGYLHTFEASRFFIGAEVSYEVDISRERWVGEHGVFVMRAGSSRGTSNSTSPARDRPPLLPPELHDDETVAYFVDGGLDADQIESVTASNIVGGNGAGSVEVGFRYTSLSRSWEGIPVLDSVASASWNDAGETVSEGVYWPEIPCEVLDEASLIRADIGQPDSTLVTLVRDSLGSEFEVYGPAITHASSSRPDDEPFSATAVLIVSQTGTSYYFDLNGEVVRTIGSR